MATEALSINCGTVHEMAESGLGAREIARILGTPVGTVLSAAPECFEPPPEPVVETVRGRAAHELADRARVLQATGAKLPEIAEALGTTESRARWALSLASREGLHRQKRPIRRR